MPPLNSPPIFWQPQNGPYLLWHSLAISLQKLDYEPQRLVLVYDNPAHRQIGLLTANTIYCPADQSIDIAIGLATANPALKVVVMTTSQSIYFDQLSNLLAACQANHNLSIVATTSDVGISSAGASSALITGLSWLGRAFSADWDQISHLFMASLKHDGLSVLEILVPPNLSVTTSYHTYRSRIFKLQGMLDKRADWPANNVAQTIQLLTNATPRLDTGLFYRRLGPSEQSQLLKQLGSPLVDQPLKSTNLKALLDTFD